MRPTLRAPDDSYEYPAWTRNALGGLPAANRTPGLFMGAQTIACTFLDLLANPAELAAARSESLQKSHRRWRAGSEMGGTICCRASFGPPVDPRWPEYCDRGAGDGNGADPNSAAPGSGGGETL